MGEIFRSSGNTIRTTVSFQPQTPKIRPSNPTVDVMAGGPIDDSQRPFVELLIQAQSRLFAYTVTLIPNLDTARDVLQDANRVLLEKADTFDRERDFISWACGIIRNRVKAHYRDLSRDKLVFSDELVEKIASVSDGMISRDQRQSALTTCYEKLTDHQRMMIDMRYQPEGSVATMAAELGRTTGSISTSLHKIRRILEQCIEQVLLPS